eukprot:CAMPEP_0116882538 /NCGR_PEP_ID=MMETSP0463-20121206/14815_1 /TAXON_ID=181622 /ORGANISM="Strombidinopsis sp, Strain SopsisLIS2011" /LENGTH=88 /DNA_ID=CAMNT_0004535913 /DNA_START=945 /DNA_END=1211 /DNA_ORIENTATION=-
MTEKKAKNLTRFIQSIVPLTCLFMTNTDNLTNTVFTPKKNYGTNKMESGLLELISGTIMVLDETEMIAGKIEGHGVENIKSMATLIEN